MQPDTAILLSSEAIPLQEELEGNLIYVYAVRIAFRQAIIALVNDPEFDAQQPLRIEVPLPSNCPEDAVDAAICALNDAGWDAVRQAAGSSVGRGSLVCTKATSRREDGYR